VSTASDQPIRNASAPTFGTLNANHAANEDHLPKAATNLNSLSADHTATGWDAYDVWRRLIKEARDRR
jgi:hypothetical protein